MNKLENSAKAHLSYLCEELDDRCVGSDGNLLATYYFENQLKKSAWNIERQYFSAFDWDKEYAKICIGDLELEVFASPYSEACDIEAETVIVSTVEDLEKINAAGKIAILKDELTKEPLMPKNFTFYNPEHHKRIVLALEKSKAEALVFLVGTLDSNTGKEVIFPIIEDGDFEIPSVYISEEDGDCLLRNSPKKIVLTSKTTKRPSRGYNIIGRKGNEKGKRIAVTAHIDAKKYSPGALDNATGVTTLLLLSEILKDYEKDYLIELIALNGEDYYSVPGQITFMEERQDNFEDIALNINIDGVGMNKGKTAISIFNLPANIDTVVHSLLDSCSGLTIGIPWYQGDHSMFIQHGVPAIAITSGWLLEHMETQRITHTENDNLSIVDVSKLSELALKLKSLLFKL